MSKKLGRSVWLGLLACAGMAQAGDFATKPTKIVAKYGARGVVFAPDNTLFAYMVEGGVATFDTTGKRVAFHKTEGGPALQLVPLGDGARLVAGNAANQTIDVATGKTTPAPAWETLGRCEAATDHAVYGVVFPTGKEGALALLDPATGKALRTVARYPTKTGTIPAQIALDPTCTRAALFFGADPRKEVIVVVDLVTGKKLRDITHGVTIGAIAWSRDGKQLLVGDKQGQLVRIDAATGKALRTTKVASELVTTVHPLRDGTTVVGSGGTGGWLLRVLDADKDALVQELPNAGCSTPMDTAVSADDSRIAVSCERNTDFGEGAAVLIYQRQP
ncbi:MAG: PQQ-binding-like beta-propeller repeat protein [Proteobacteria bacterium]|nr:PQQ-binding-like beta-propeller repeat protein [Pseudomonadota bacterium]